MTARARASRAAARSRTPLAVAMRFGADDVLVGRLALDDRTVVFEYAPSFISSGLALNPLWAPPSAGLVRPRAPRLFDGLHGVLADSLPDAWGDLLVRRRVEAQGLSYASLTVLDRLALVGTRGSGALVYLPEIAHERVEGRLDIDTLACEAGAVLRGDATDVLGRLEELGGSSGGARPKVLLGRDDAGTAVAGTHELGDGFSAWIVKFRGSQDPEDIGALEAAYADMARAAGLDVADSRLLRSAAGKAYFASRRFDRLSGGRRVHMASAAGLLDADWSVPSIDYDTLLALTQRLTREHADVEMMLRRMVFNVVAHNRDDHAKQHAYLMDPRGVWRLAPAYDLTYSRGPGAQHYLAVGGKGDAIARADVDAVAKKHLIPPRSVDAIVDAVTQAASEFRRYASAYGVGDRTTTTVRRDLDAQLAAIANRPSSRVRAPAPRRD